MPNLQQQQPTRPTPMTHAPRPPSGVPAPTGAPGPGGATLPPLTPGRSLGGGPITPTPMTVAPPTSGYALPPNATREQIFDFIRNRPANVPWGAIAPQVSEALKRVVPAATPAGMATPTPTVRYGPGGETWSSYVPGALPPGPGPWSAAPPGTPPAGTPPTPSGTPAQTPTQQLVPTWLEMLVQQFGRGNPFGDMPAGPDPIAAARERADAWVNPRLAELRERFAGTGIAPTSGRSGLEQGRLVGAAEAGLGTELAQLGVEQRRSDLDRLMGGFLDAGRLTLAQQQLPLEAINALFGAGNTLLGLQESERVPPLLQAILPFLTNFGPINQGGWSATRT